MIQIPFYNTSLSIDFVTKSWVTWNQRNIRVSQTTKKKGGRKRINLVFVYSSLIDKRNWIVNSGTPVMVT